ncbi:MAG: AmmeMemoRadiSam system radical SAM enzyme, partial [Nanoarchaeota archaeon]|nr:AmmeMemoRadiSam system radical SAM enzyme [Nanoarchaeota archaeon]
VQCELCPRFCSIKESDFGSCGVRKNINGKLMSLVYEQACSAGADPIEKKPLFHFLPGSKSFSVATVGCNFHCLHCQNWAISQANPEDYPSEEMSAEDVVNKAVASDCHSIAYTYTEPIIFYEWMLDTARFSRENGIKNVLVSNGYINPEPLKELCGYLDAANIDIKGNDRFYKEVCGVPSKKPVFESLKILKENGVWVEVTYLIIPTYNDNQKEIEEVCKWVRDNLGKETPIHFSRFFPMYKLTEIDATPRKTLEMAKKIAEKYLDYVYVGNIFTKGGEDTVCPKCRKFVIKRRGYDVIENKLKKGKCPCGNMIAGVF